MSSLIGTDFSVLEETSIPRVRKRKFSEFSTPSPRIENCLSRVFYLQAPNLELRALTIPLYPTLLTLYPHSNIPDEINETSIGMGLGSLMDSLICKEIDRERRLESNSSLYLLISLLDS